MTSNPLPAAVDLVLEATVAGSFSRLGYEARRRLDDWEDRRPTPSPASASCSPGRLGIGRAATGQLLDLGAEVLVVGRDEQRTIKAVAELDIAHPNGTVTAHIAELADLSAVRELADDLVDFGEPVGRRRPQRRRPPRPEDDDG